MLSLTGWRMTCLLRLDGPEPNGGIYDGSGHKSQNA